MRVLRWVVVVGFLGAAAAAADGLRAAAAEAHGLRPDKGPNFDKLTEKDRAAMAARFKKEVWPILTREGKDSCVGCHTTKAGGQALRLTGDADKDFVKMLREGFFLKGDAGSLLERLNDPDPKRRMPPKGYQPWKEADVQVLRAFVNDLHERQRR